MLADKILKYILEACAVAFVMKLGTKGSLKEIILMTATIATAHMILDTFAPGVGVATRQGSGFAAGMKLIAHGGQGGQGGQGGGAMGLQTAMGMQRSLGQSGGAMGLQTAMGMQRSLNLASGQCGGAMGLQTAMGMQRSLDLASGQSGGGLGQTPGERGLVYGKISDDAPEASDVPKANTVYSQSLIDITTGGQQLVLPAGSDYVSAVDTKDTMLDNRLFKLRLEAVGIAESKHLVPVHYGDPVKMVYNSGAQVIALNHDGDLNSLDSDSKVLFTLVNADHPASKEVVDTADKILIKKSEEAGNCYLKASQVRGRVEADASVDKATSFTVGLTKGCGPLWMYN